MNGTIRTPNIANHYRRHGITPVVSIVLLLMMTIAAAGAAYSWFDQMQTDIQQQARQQLETSVETRDLQCIIDPAGDQLLVALKNIGKRDIRGDAVDVYVYDNNGNLYTAITNLNWRTSANWEMASPPNSGFLDSGGFGQVSIDMPASSQFTDGAFYTVTVEFSNTGISKPVGGCIAE